MRFCSRLSRLGLARRAGCGRLAGFRRLVRVRVRVGVRVSVGVRFRVRVGVGVGVGVRLRVRVRVRVITLRAACHAGRAASCEEAAASRLMPRMSRPG